MSAGYKFAAGEAFRWGSVKGALLTLEAAMKMDDSSLFEMKDDKKVYQYAALLKDQSTLWKNVYLDVAAKYDEISGIEDVKERKEELSSQSDGGQPLIDGAESVPSKVIEDIEEQLEKSNVPLITSWDKYAGSN